MKDLFKLIGIAISGLIGAVIPCLPLYFLWSWCMLQVGSVIHYAGVIKIVVTLGLIMVGGSLTLILAIIGAVFMGALAVAILDFK